MTPRHTASARTPRRRAPVMLLALTLLLLTTGCGDMITVTPTSELTLRPPAQTSTILAADGSVLAELHAEEDRRWVPLSAVPRVVRDAVIAIEDERFHDHAGVDLRAVARAVLVNARSGQIEQGGSTITQQLAKNAVTGDERTLERKLQEASIALQLEHTYSKEEILEHYLNTVYFGGGAYGIQTAAQRYFGRDVGELALHEAALLAGLLRSPARYDPFDHPDAARARRDTVLAAMAEHDLVTHQAAERAAKADLGVVERPAQDAWRAPYFVSHVLSELRSDPAFAALGADPVTRADALFRGGLRIETTLDPTWQAAAEDAVASTLDRPEDPGAAVVSMSPADGSVRAMVGGRDWNDPDDPVARFNLATQAERQPGSTFKEVVLAAALERGWKLDDRVDAPARMQFANSSGHPAWTVANYDDVNYGEVTLREATARSVNTVYAQLVDDLGAPAVAEMARRLGVRTPLDPVRAIALGAQEVTVLDMATVQTTLAAGGVYRPPTVVLRITDPQGDVLYERGRTPGERVLDEQVAWQLTTALQDVVRHGTGQRADLRRPTAGKTGTTQDTADAWFTGYTPDFAAAVWVGFPTGRIPMEPPKTRVRVEGGTWPAEIFARLGVRALQDTPASDFAVPEVALTRVQVDLARDCLPTRWTPPDRIGERAYLSGAEPTRYCDDEPRMVTAAVPDVTGERWEDARELLAEAGLRAVPQPTYTLAVPPGFAMAQDPPAGRERTLSAGHVVRVRVSSADRTQVDLPTVIGLPVDEAVARLREAGFPVDVGRDCPADVDAPAAPAAGSHGADCGPPGVVYEQTPAGGKTTVHSVVEVHAYPG